MRVALLAGGTGGAKLAAGMQESGLRPLDYGDRDSLGVFQQRAAWGTPAQRINPTSAARMFYKRYL